MDIHIIVTPNFIVREVQNLGGHILYSASAKTSFSIPAVNGEKLSGGDGALRFLELYHKVSVLITGRCCLLERLKMTMSDITGKGESGRVFNPMHFRQCERPGKERGMVLPICDNKRIAYYVFGRHVKRASSASVHTFALADGIKCKPFMRAKCFPFRGKNRTRFGP